MGRGGASQRLFVAAYPPRDAAENLLGSLDRLELPAHSRTTVDQLHLTVQFVGETPAREIDSVVESVERAAAGIGAFELRATGMVTLPRGTAARLVAAEFNAPPELMEIHRRLVSRLARRARERQHFTPHMTLCRFKHGESVGEILVPLDGPQFSVRTIRLMRSVLRPQAAEHLLVAEVPL